MSSRHAPTNWRHVENVGPTFVKKCHQCRQEIQQTELLFFMPPCQRTKSRYFNLDSLIYWADKVLKYKKKQDFSLIDKRQEIDRVNLVDLLLILDQEKIKSLSFSLGVSSICHPLN